MNGMIQIRLTESHKVVQYGRSYMVGAPGFMTLPQNRHSCGTLF
jgi:hypothetical protein